MIPLRDTIPSRSKPYITVLLILANVLVFFYQFTMSGRQSVFFTYRYGFIPLRMTELLLGSLESPLYSFIPVFTGMFLHGSLLHLISNMWVLWLFGDNVEDRMGHGRYLLFYLLCGFAANFTHYVSDFVSPVPAVGASGAIAGIMGAYFLLFPTSKITTLVPLFFIPLFINIPAVIYLLIWFLSQLYSGTVQAFSDSSSVSGIAWWAHIGGFIGGMVLHRLFIRRVRPAPYYYYDQYTRW